MSVNNESVVFQGLSVLIRDSVLGPICQHLAGKGVQVTTDELSGCLKLPSTPTGSSIGGGIPPISNSTPPLGGLSGLTKAAPIGPGPGPTTGRGRKKAPISEDQRCIYMITKGRNKGGQCEKQRDGDNPFCSQCKTKKAAIAQLEAMGGVPSLGAMPSMSGPPQAGATTMTTAPQDNTTRLQVMPMGNGFYKEKNHNLYIRTTGQNEYLCVGYCDTANNVLPLTPEKMEACKLLNLNYIDPEKENTDQAGGLPQAGGLTQAGGLPQADGLPQAGASPSNAAPGLPSVGGLPSAGLSQTGGLPSVGGGLPSVSGLSQTNSIPSGLPQVDQSSPVPSGLPQVAGAGVGGLPTVPQMNDTSLPDIPGVTDMGGVGEPIDGDED